MWTLEKFRTLQVDALLVFEFIQIYIRQFMKWSLTVETITHLKTSFTIKKMWQCCTDALGWGKRKTKLGALLLPEYPICMLVVAVALEGNVVTPMRHQYKMWWHAMYTNCLSYINRFILVFSSKYAVIYILASVSNLVSLKEYAPKQVHIHAWCWAFTHIFMGKIGIIIILPFSHKSYGPGMQ